MRGERAARAAGGVLVAATLAVLGVNRERAEARRGEQVAGSGPARGHWSVGRVGAVPLVVVAALSPPAADRRSPSARGRTPGSRQLRTARTGS